MREILIDSILITVVIFLGYYLYVLIIRQLRGKKGPKYATLHPLEKSTVKGRVDFLVELHEPTEVLFELLDEEDVTVQTIYDGRQEPGKHIHTLNTTEVGNGVYYYRFKTPIQVETRKLMVLN